MTRNKPISSASAMGFPPPLKATPVPSRTIGGEARPSCHRDRRVEQGRPFQNGTRCLKTKHEARCQRPLADPRQKLSGAEVGFGVPCTPLLDSLEKPGLPRQRP
jgi:hypothetical protein